MYTVKYLTWSIQVHVLHVSYFRSRKITLTVRTISSAIKETFFASFIETSTNRSITFLNQYRTIYLFSLTILSTHVNSAYLDKTRSPQIDDIVFLKNW